MTSKALPDQWSCKTLRELATINYGRDPSLILDDDGKYPVIGTSNDERQGNGFLYDGESVVLGRKGTIDRVHFVSGRFWTIDTAYFLSKFNNALPKWLYYFLTSIDFRSLNEATGVPSLSRDLLYTVKIPTPPKAEQTEIAKILSTVDRAIEQTEALIAKQQRIKTGLMQDLLTRGIDEHGNLRSEQTHEFKDSQLSSVPKCWRVQSLGVALHQAGGHMQTGPFGSQLHAHEYVNEGIPVIMPQDIIDGSISIESIARVPCNRADDLRRHRTEFNDVVFSRRGDLTRAAAIGERELGWLCGTGCFLLRVPPDAIHAPWLVDAYRHHHVQQQIEAHAIGTTMPSLNNSVMERLTVAFPGINEQREIVRLREAANAKINTLAGHSLKLHFIKTGLMQQLLTGKCRVTINTA